MDLADFPPLQYQTHRFVRRPLIQIVNHRYLKFEFGYLSKKWYLSLQMLDRLANCLQNQGEI